MYLLKLQLDWLVKVLCDKISSLLCNFHQRRHVLDVEIHHHRVSVTVDDLRADLGNVCLEAEESVNENESNFE